MQLYLVINYHQQVNQQMNLMTRERIIDNGNAVTVYNNYVHKSTCTNALVNIFEKMIYT